MNDKRNSHQPTSSGLNLGDIYYVLFRHKFLILGCSVLGFIAAGIIYAERPTVFTSEATLQVKRIKDTTETPTIIRDGATTDTTGGAEGLINGELAILSSFDLALRVASNGPPSKILASYGGGDSVIAAAGVIRDSLGAERMPKSSVIRISLSFRDADIVQPLLNTVINSYQELHDEIHLRSDAELKLTSEATELHDHWKDMESQLRQKQKAAGVTDVAAARKGMEVESARLHFDIKGAQWALEMSQAKLAKLKGIKPKKTNETNVVAEPELPKEITGRYTQSVQLLAQLKQEYLGLLSTYSDQSTLAKEKQAQIDKAEEKIAKMEKEEPRLARQKAMAASAAQNPSNALSPV